MWQPDGIYLNTASYGLPPEPAWRALQSALDDWHHGRTSWEAWGDATHAARERFARLVGVPAGWVATGPTVSDLASRVATVLEPGARVLAPDVEFTSNLWPYAVRPGVTIETVPAARLAEAIDARTDAVAFSAVQSSSGEVADLDAIAAAARHHGALTVVDATQAVGWLPVDAAAFDVTLTAAYKWLMSPRGTAFATVRPELLERLHPVAAGWFAAEDIHGAYYGMPVRLAADARRLDVSPAWFSWVGTLPALDVVLERGVEAIHTHDLGLANAFREGLGLAPGDSAIVSVGVEGAERRLAGTEVRAAVRAGALRTSWHLYNTIDDVGRVLELLHRR